MNAIEQCVGADGFAVGARRSRADVVCYYYFGEYFARRYQLGARLEALLPACPKLRAIVASVAAQAQVWIAAVAYTDEESMILDCLTSE
jgi:glutathione S-transferase